MRLYPWMCLLFVACAFAEDFRNQKNKGNGNVASNERLLQLLSISKPNSSVREKQYTNEMIKHNNNIECTNSLHAQTLVTYLIFSMVFFLTTLQMINVIRGLKSKFSDNCELLLEISNSQHSVLIKLMNMNTSPRYWCVQESISVHEIMLEQRFFMSRIILNQDIHLIQTATNDTMSIPQKVNVCPFQCLLIKRLLNEQTTKINLMINCHGIGHYIHVIASE